MHSVSRPDIRTGNDRARQARFDYLQVETAILQRPQARNDIMNWLCSNQPVNWIVEKVQTSHGITLTPTMLSAFSVRNDLGKRAPETNLIPWKIRLYAHQRLYPYRMLRAETLLRTGGQNAREVLHRLVLWKAKLTKDGTVVDYRPDTCDVWRYVPARPGIDTDLIRVPDE